METIQLEGTAEERAEKVGKAIRCALKANGGRLKRLYYQDGCKGDCVACAVGSLALACDIKRFGTRDRRGLKEQILDHSDGGRWISADEVDQLEMGFEGLSSMIGLAGSPTPSNLAAIFATVLDPDTANPFYKLGQELAMEISA